MKQTNIKKTPKILQPTDYEQIRRFMLSYPSFFSQSPQWIYENWDVFISFYARTCQLIKRGRTHYSSRTIVEVMRHESALKDTHEDFKISNNASPDLGRAFVVLNPEYADFWKYNRDGEAFKQAIHIF